MVGIENLKAIIVFSAKNESLIARLVAGGVTKDDIVLLPEFVMALPDLIKIHWVDVIPEAKDLTAEEAQELIAAHNEAFKLPEDQAKLEATIENALSLITKVVAIVKDVIALFKKPAAPVEPTV